MYKHILILLCLLPFLLGIGLKKFAGGGFDSFNIVNQSTTKTVTDDQTINFRGDGGVNITLDTFPLDYELVFTLDTSVFGAIDLSTTPAVNTGSLVIDTNGDGVTILTVVLTYDGGTGTYFLFGADAYPTGDNQFLAYDEGTNKVIWVDPAATMTSFDITDDDGNPVQTVENNETIRFDGAGALVITLAEASDDHFYSITLDTSLVNAIKQDNDGDPASFGLAIDSNGTTPILTPVLVYGFSTDDYILPGVREYPTAPGQYMVSTGTPNFDMAWAGPAAFDITDDDSSPIQTVDNSEQLRIIGTTGIDVVLSAAGDNHLFTIRPNSSELTFLRQGTPEADGALVIDNDGDGSTIITDVLGYQMGDDDFWLMGIGEYPTVDGQALRYSSEGNDMEWSLRRRKDVVATTGTTDTPSAAELQGSFHVLSNAAIVTITLDDIDTVGAGANACWYDSDGTKKVVITPDGDDIITRGATTQAAGDGIDSSGAEGDYICLVAIDADTNWVTVDAQGTWALAVTLGTDFDDPFSNDISGWTNPDSDDGHCTLSGSTAMTTGASGVCDFTTGDEGEGSNTTVRDQWVYYEFTASGFNDGPVARRKHADMTGSEYYYHVEKQSTVQSALMICDGENAGAGGECDCTNFFAWNPNITEGTNDAVILAVAGETTATQFCIWMMDDSTTFDGWDPTAWPPADRCVSIDGTIDHPKLIGHTDSCDGTPTTCSSWDDAPTVAKGYPVNDVDQVKVGTCNNRYPTGDRVVDRVAGGSL